MQGAHGCTMFIVLVQEALITDPLPHAEVQKKCFEVFWGVGVFPDMLLHFILIKFLI